MPISRPDTAFSNRRPMADGQQGFAIVLVLCLMAVMMMILTMVLVTSTSNLTQADGYSKLSQVRAVADAGQASANYAMTEQALPLINVMLTGYVTAFARSGSSAKTAPIIPISAYPTVLTNLNAMTVVDPSGSVGSGTDAATFSTDTTFSNFRADQASFTNSGQTYYVDYKLSSTGNKGQFKRTINAAGTLRIRLGRQYLNQFLMLADDGGSQQGNFFATGMDYNGPVHINKNWQFFGQPTFSLGATTASSTVGMYTCTAGDFVQVSTQSTDCAQPNWNGSGLTYNAPTVNLPPNAFSQQNAALGLDPANTVVPTNTALCLQVNVTLPCPPVNGVYLPATGGIYVKGNASIVMSVTAGNAQVYDITVDDNTTRIVVDYVAGTTVKTTNVAVNPSTLAMTPTSISATTTRSGAPNGQLYVDGAIVGLKGPPRTGSLPNPVPTASVPTQILPAIARDTQLNVAAKTTIAVTGDVTYQDDPRSVADAKNVLGLMAGEGDIQIAASAPNDVYVHGAVIAGSTGSGFSAQNYDSRGLSGGIHLLGSMAEAVDPPRGVAYIDRTGVIQMQNGYGDDFKFDQRFLNGAVAPPFFPATSLFQAQTAWPTQSNWQEQ